MIILLKYDDRYTILLEVYLRGAGKQRLELLKQHDVHINSIK